MEKNIDTLIRYEEALEVAIQIIGDNEVCDTLEEILEDVSKRIVDTPLYALYDTQLGGYKAGYAGMYVQWLEEDAVERIIELSQSDDEPVDESLSDKQILLDYGYEIHKVTRKDYETILNSTDYGLLTTVKL